LGYEIILQVGETCRPICDVLPKVRWWRSTTYEGKAFTGWQAPRRPRRAGMAAWDNLCRTLDYWKFHWPFQQR